MLAIHLSVVTYLLSGFGFFLHTLVRFLVSFPVHDFFDRITLLNLFGFRFSGMIAFFGRFKGLGIIIFKV